MNGTSLYTPNSSTFFLHRPICTLLALPYIDLSWPLIPYTSVPLFLSFMYSYGLYHWGVYHNVTQCIAKYRNVPWNWSSHYVLFIIVQGSSYVSSSTSFLICWPITPTDERRLALPSPLWSVVQPWVTIPDYLSQPLYNLSALKHTGDCFFHPQSCVRYLARLPVIMDHR